MPSDTNTSSGGLKPIIGLLVVMIAVALYVWDMFSLWNGYPFESILQGNVLLNAFRIFLPILLGGLLFMYRKTTNKQEIISKWVLDYVWILVAGIGLNNLTSILHLAMSIGIYTLFEKYAGEDKTDFTKAIIILTLIDFFGFAALKGGLSLFGSVISNIAFSRLMIPIWIYFSLKFCADHNGSNVFSFLILIVFVANIILAFDGISLIRNGNVENMDQSMITDFLNSFSSGLAGIKQIFNMSQYLQPENTGTGEQTENPQGVYLKPLDTSEQIFSEGSPVYVWANLEARTLDMPIEVRINCSLETDEAVVTGIVNTATNEEFIVVPVYTGVERAIPCMFDTLPAGDYEVKFTATFDFAADAYKKIYLMDRMRYINELKVLKDKGIEPTRESILSVLHDIQDTAPEAIFTSGPIQVGLGAQQVPWDIDESNNNIRPYFGVTVKNYWETGGKILSIKNIYIKIPDTFFIQDVEKSCSVKMQTTDEQSEEGYVTYKNVDPLTNIEESKTVNCLLYVGKDSLDTTPVTLRYLKAHVDYSYMLEESIPLEITPLSLLEGDVLQRNMVCCKLVDTSTTKYQWVADSQTCIDKNSQAIKAVVAETNSLCEEQKCCQVMMRDDIIGRKFVASEEECTAFGNENQGIGRLLPVQDNYLCA